MAIRHDYLMDMIARFAESIARALARGSEGDPTQGVSAYEEVVGEVLDMDAPVALALSAPSLVTMMQISAVDERLAAYAAFCLDSIAQAYELQGDPLAEVRQAQAAAIRQAYALADDVIPPEVRELISRGE